MVFVIETLVAVIATATATGTYGTIMGYMYKFRVGNIFAYKYRKRIIYKGIKKAIQEKDIQSLRDYFNVLVLFDSKYDRQKTIKMKKKYGLTDEILNNRKLFRMKFDTDYLIQQMSENNINSSGEIIEMEAELYKREQSLMNIKGAKNVIEKEQELIKREKEIRNKEEELQEIISNLNKLLK